MRYTDDMPATNRTLKKRVIFMTSIIRFLGNSERQPIGWVSRTDIAMTQLPLEVGTFALARIPSSASTSTGVLAENIFLQDGKDGPCIQTQKATTATQKGTAGKNCGNIRPHRKTLEHCEPPYCSGLADRSSILKE